MSENKYDKGYKRILGKKKNFLSLLKNFIYASWVDGLTEEDLEIIDKEFIPKDFKEKESDLIYKIRVKDQEIIIYFLMELQSSVDFTIPFRLLNYMTELYKRLFLDTVETERERKDFRLPAIVPVVLYNGADSWSVVKSFKEYLGGYELFKENVIDFQYILLNVNSYNEEFLLEAGNLISSIFALDRKQDKGQFIRTMTKLAKIGMKLTQEEQIDLADWVKDVISKKALSQGNEKEIRSLVESLLKGEVVSMTYAIERIFDEEREKAEQKAILAEKKEFAEKLLSDGVEVGRIMKYTGLTKEKIEEIRDSLSV